jgi:hypothetical protein
MNKETLTVETDEDGTTTYRNADGDFHNSHGPAVVGADGYEAYYINGKRHNPDGPAIVWPSGYKNYFINGEELTQTGLRLFGQMAAKSYFINGEKLTEAEFTAWQAEQAAK